MLVSLVPKFHLAEAGDKHLILIRISSKLRYVAICIPKGCSASRTAVGGLKHPVYSA